MGAGQGLMPISQLTPYRGDRCTTGVLQTGQVYYQCTTERTGVPPVYYRQDLYTDSTDVQTVHVYSTVQVYGTVLEICTVQVYRQYRFTIRCTTGVVQTLQGLERN